MPHYHTFYLSDLNHIDCRYPQETLALIWGRDQSTVSRCIDEWADEWGEAGEDLSILDISEEYLENTYPERYRAAGLVRVCALPEKDFMIHTPRGNTVLTRLAYSDKVFTARFCTRSLSQRKAP